MFQTTNNTQIAREIVSKRIMRKWDTILVAKAIVVSKICWLEITVRVRIPPVAQKSKLNEKDSAWS